MKVLILDDDKEIREESLLKYWNSKGILEVTWLTRWPTLFLDTILNTSGLTHISFDHDLGHTDVTVELNKLLFLEPDKYVAAFKDKHVLIHSMNVCGAQNIAGKLQGIAKSVTILPLHLL